MVAVMATGGTESGEGLQQAAEAEGDQHGLDAQVAAADGVEDGAQVLEASGQHGHLVEPQGHDHDPHDGEQAVDGALGGRQRGELGRHAEAEDRHEQGHGERGQPRHVGARLEGEQHHEKGQQGQAADQG